LPARPSAAGPVCRADIERRVAELLALVNLPGQGDKYPAQLSGGEQQRVALTRALATSPGLLLLDEPLSALDAKVRAHLRVEMKALQRRLGVTTIMVTHDQEEALTMADRIVVMNHGVIEQVGAPTEIYGRPRTLFVAEFVGAMNRMRGQSAGRGRVTLGDMTLAAQAHDAPAGAAVVCAIRPEDVVVRAVGDGDVGDGDVSGGDGDGDGDVGDGAVPPRHPRSLLSGGGDGDGGGDGGDGGGHGDGHGEVGGDGDVGGGDDGTGARENCFHARVEYLEFLGSFWRLSLAAERLGEAALTCDLSGNAMRRLGLEVGATVRVELPAARILVFAQAHDA